MNYEIDTKRGLLKTANGKAVGIDKVPGDWIKIHLNDQSQDFKISKLNEILKKLAGS